MKKIYHRPYLVPFLLSLLIFLIIFTRRSTILDKAEIKDETITIVEFSRIKRGPPLSTGGGRIYSMDSSIYRELFSQEKRLKSITYDDFKRMRAYRALKEMANSRKLPPRGRGLVNADTALGRKRKSDYEELNTHIAAIIGYRRARKNIHHDMTGFETRIQDYIMGRTVKKSWRTLWTAEKPATFREKTKLLGLLKRLYYICQYEITIEKELLRKTVYRIFRSLPDELAGQNRLD